MKRAITSLYNETLFRNSVYLMLSTGTMSVFGFVFWIIVAHNYRPDQVGVAAALIAAMNFITYFALLGFNSTFIRFLLKSKSQSEHINTGLLLVGAAAIVASSCFVLVGPAFAPKLGLLHHHILYGCGYIVLTTLATLNLITDSIYIAYRHAGYNFIIDGLIGSGTQLLLPLALVFLGAYGIYAAQGLAAGAAFAISIVFLVKKFLYRPKLRISRPVLREVVRYSSSNYLASLLNTAPTIIVPIIVLDKLGAAATGYYYLAFMVANVLFTVAYAVAQSLFAEGSYAEHHLRALTKRAALFMAALLLPASLLLVTIGPLVLDVFGRAYGQYARQVLTLLAVSAPFLAASGLGSIVLRITKQTNVLVCINVLYAVSICGLSLVWAPRGLPWVAGAWAAGQVITALVTFVALGFMHRQRASAPTPAE
jgi:O-antigen/teichoic acid export membrane protein